MIPGGGASLVHAIKAIDKYIETAPKTNGHASTWADEKIGIEIVKRALEEPLRQIAANAGFEGSVEVNSVKLKTSPHGFDAMTGEIVDMFKAGIVEPFTGDAFGAAKCSIDRCAHPDDGNADR